MSRWCHLTRVTIWHREGRHMYGTSVLGAAVAGFGVASVEVEQALGDAPGHWEMLFEAPHAAAMAHLPARLTHAGSGGEKGY